MVLDKLRLFYVNLGQNRELHEFSIQIVKLKWCLHGAEGLEPPSRVCLGCIGF